MRFFPKLLIAFSFFNAMGMHSDILSNPTFLGDVLSKSLPVNSTLRNILITTFSKTIEDEVSPPTIRQRPNICFVAKSKAQPLPDPQANAPGQRIWAKCLQS